MKALHLLLGLLVSLGAMGTAQAQAAPTQPAEPYADFAELLTRLNAERFSQLILRYPDLLPPPVIYRDSVYDEDRTMYVDYTVRLSATPLGLRRRVLRLPNPFGSRDSLLSRSVVYQQHLVALFTPGYFACYRLPDLQRDEVLEKQLNTTKFARHWTLNRQLVGWRRGHAYCFDTVRHAWQPYRQPLPVKGVPKVFEDERFVCRMTCNGEFGGYLYFFDKTTRLTHYLPATCATSVWQQAGHYHVLVSLSHMMGTASSGVITDPTNLPLASTRRNPNQDWQYSFPTSVPDPDVQLLLDFGGMTMPGAFRWHDETFYLVNWRRTLFLATIADQQISIVDPLFSTDLPAYRPLTVAYPGGVTLASLPSYDEDSEEGACLLFQDQRVTKVEWGKPR